MGVQCNGVGGWGERFMGVQCNGGKGLCCLAKVGFASHAQFPILHPLQMVQLSQRVLLVVVGGDG
jgi:hypothetical protein